MYYIFFCVNVFQLHYQLLKLRITMLEKWTFFASFFNRLYQQSTDGEIIHSNSLSFYHASNQIYLFTRIHFKTLQYYFCELKITMLEK
jgi:hypothetical protein